MTKAQPLVLLHGALGAKEQFIALAEKLKNHLEVYTLNFEGHGGRSSERDFSLDHFMENLNDYIEGHHLHKPSIFGFSMGGYVALKFAIKYPDKADRIMTLGTKFDWSPESATKEVKMLKPDLIEEKVPPFATQLKDRHAPLDWKMVLSKTADMMCALGDGEALQPKDFSQVNCPVLVTVGSADTMVSVEESQKIANAIPNSSFEVFKDFKHPLEQVDVEVLAGRVSDFFF